MKKLLAVTVIMLMAAPVAQAIPNPHIAGSMQGWDAGANPMNGPVGGVYDLTFSGLDAGGWQEFKVTNGTWDEDIPISGNAWGFADGAGDFAITYDSNTYNDGWIPATDRIGLGFDPGNQWQAVGDFNGWNNNDASWNMSAASLPAGQYEVIGTIATAGTYQYKAIESGSWNAIGTERSINAGTIEFTTTTDNETVNFQVDVLSGTARVIPEPATLALFGLGGLVLLRRRR